jgi:hypothetical protein
MSLRKSSSIVILLLSSSGKSCRARILANIVEVKAVLDRYSILLKQTLVSRACIERRWRHCSTGSESSTGSSDASVWTTGVSPKYAKGNTKNSTNGSSSRRYVRAKNLEEGALLTSIRPGNNSESSDTTDTTTATTTTTTLLKSLVVVSASSFAPLLVEGFQSRKQRCSESVSSAVVCLNDRFGLS